LVQLPGESAINSAEVYATLSRIAEDSIHNVWPKDAPRPSMRPVMEASYFSVTALQNQHFLSFSQIANPEMIHSHPFFIAMSRISSWTSTTPPLKKKSEVWSSPRHLRPDVDVPSLVVLRGCLDANVSHLGGPIDSLSISIATG